MNIRKIVVTLCILNCLIQTAHSAESSPEQRAAQIAPLVSQYTIIVAHVDLDRLDFAALDKAREAIVGKDVQIEEIVKARPIAEAIVKTLRNQDVHDAYVVINVDNLPIPHVYVAVAAPNKAADVQRTLIQAGVDEKQCFVMSGLVVVSEIAGIEQLKQLKPVERPELLEALRAAENPDAQVLLIPSSDIRRAIGETVHLPDALGAGSGQVVSDGIHWAVLQVHLKPQPKLTLTVKSKDEAAAQALKTILADALQLLSKMQNTGFDPAVVERVANNIQVHADRVVWTLSADNGKGDLADLLREPIKKARTAATRAQNANNLKQLGLAMHNYHDTNKHLPAPAILDAQGKPMLSWRVSVLPYVPDGFQLYKEFHLDEPWDSEHNKKLIEKMPAVFATPTAKLPAGHTTYLVPTGPLALFRKPEGLQLREILDGTSNVIMIVDAVPERSVVWTKPEDLEVSAENPTAGLLAPNSDGFFVTLADGSVQFFEAKSDKTLQLGDLNLTMEKLLAMFGPDDGKLLK